MVDKAQIRVNRERTRSIGRIFATAALAGSIRVRVGDMGYTFPRQGGCKRDGVSRLEQRSDLLLSTLRKTVEAMGGNLSLVAEFPDRAPVVLAGISEQYQAQKTTSRKSTPL